MCGGAERARHIGEGNGIHNSNSNGIGNGIHNGNGIGVFVNWAVAVYQPGPRTA
ncbi:hypothetical protein [Streptomyces sp. NPDC006012]|uniref:hypothetical protein n=1 Tax=Streptomyces sp. NPDC006012 TaxID=3364739 RepID=UPI0036B33F03